MEHSFSSEVTTSPEGFTTITVSDQVGGQPKLHLFERSTNGQEVWVMSGACAFSLNQEQTYEVLPFLINFLQTGRLVTR